MFDNQKLEQQLKAVANERRLDILSFLKKRHNATVGEIAKKLHISSFATSQHLRTLRTSGIVAYKRKWKYVSYRLIIPQKQPIKQIIKML